MDAGSGSDSGSSRSDGGSAPPDAGITVADFYVATNGNDAWSGTLDAPNAGGTDGPFATLPAAQAAVRTLVASSSSRTVPFLVLIRGGTYFLGAPWAFSHADDGLPGVPVVYQNYGTEQVVLSGGKVLTGWQRNGLSWTSSAPGLTDFSSLFIDGQRRRRIRTTETTYLHNAGQFLFPDAGAGTGPCSPSYAIKQPSGQTVLACFDRFYFQLGDLDPSWSGWTDPTHPIEVMAFENWTASRARLTHLDLDSGVPDAGIAFIDGNTVPGPSSGFMPRHRYLVENVKEMLADPAAHPGTFYFEPSTGALTYLATDASEDLTQATVVAAQLPQLMVSTDPLGLSDVTFRGLTFSHQDWTSPVSGTSSYSGAYYQVPAAVSVTNGTRVTFDGCTVTQVDGWGLELVGAVGAYAPTPSAPYAVQVVHSALYDIGFGALRIGRDPANGDSDANVSQYVYVHDTLLASGDRLLPGVGMWIDNAHHITVDHVDLYDFYNMGIELGHSLNWVQSQAHDDEIRFCSIHDLGQGVTSDMGCIHTATGLNLGNSFHDNVCRTVTHNPDAVGYGGNGIYLDQGSAFVSVSNNLVYDVSAAALIYNNSGKGTYQPLGTPSPVSNNIFAFFAEGGIDSDFPTDLAHDYSVDRNIFYFDQLRAFPPGPPQFQFGYQLCDAGCVNQFPFDDNLYFDVADPTQQTWRFATGQARAYGYWTLAQWQGIGEDVHSLIADPQFADAGGFDFTLSAHSPALSLGFVPFDPSQAGRLDRSFTPPSVAPAFPLQPLAKF